MIFPHENHRDSNIEDICWSPFAEEDELMAVSVDTQLLMQVWKMSQDFMFKEIDFIDKLDVIKETDIE
jgi:hypothetical protein